MKSKINKAFILAAGFGTRLKPVTDNIPKALVNFKGKPMIENVIAKITSAGIDDIYINIHHHANKMKEYFTGRIGNAKFTLIEEKILLGTGGAVKNAENYLKDSDNFIVYNTDVDTDADLCKIIDFHLLQKPLATLCVQSRKTSRYLICNSTGEITGRVEEGKNIIFKNNEQSDNIAYKAFCGIHIVNSQIFSLLPPANRPYDIIPVYMSALNENFIILGFDITNNSWKDLGKPQKL